MDVMNASTLAERNAAIDAVAKAFIAEHPLASVRVYKLLAAELGIDGLKWAQECAAAEKLLGLS